MMLRPTFAPVWSAFVQRRKGWIFASLFFLLAIPQTVLLTVVPLEAHALLGTAQAVSVLYFAIGTVSLVGRLAIPWLCHLVRRRRVFSLGTGCLVLAAFLLSTRTVPGLVAGLAASTFGYACLEITLNLYVLDHVARQELSRFEPARIFLAAGPWTIGPWLGVHLQTRVAVEAPYLVAGSAAVLLFAWFWILRLQERSVVASSARPAPSPLRYLPRFYAQPRLRLAWALATGRSAWWGMFFIYAPIFAVTSGLGEEVGGVMVSIGTGWIWLVPIWGWIGRRYGLKPLMATGYTLAGVLSLIAAAASGAPWAGVVVLLVAALATGTLDGAGNLLFLRAVRAYERAEMTTVFVSYRDVSQLVPPGVFSLLLLLFRLPAVFVAGGAMMLVLAGLTRFIPRRL
jgi:MFS transporter, ACDE family, multidrug resistance protein